MAAEALSVDDRIVLALRRISQAIDVWSRQLWRDYGLTAPQLAVLREIRAGKNISPSMIAAALHLSQPTVTGILGRMEKQGLIRRERSAIDLRNVLAVVTDAGKELVDKAPPLLRDRFCNELAKLSAPQQAEILETLERVATMMHAPEIAEGPFFFHDASDADGNSRPAASRRAKKPKAEGSDAQSPARG
jgi:DNA-binding MarR family transcriptional regulator